MADFLRAGGPDYAMVGYTLRNTLSEHGSVSRGVCECDAAGFLQAVVELTKVEKQGRGAHTGDRALSGDELVSMICGALRPRCSRNCASVQRIPAPQRAGIEKRVLHSHDGERTGGIGRRRVKVLRTPASWFGITYKEDKPQVVASIDKLVKAGEYPAKLWT